MCASPQIDNGYTRIANELLEALARIRINGEARQCLDVILRKTYGFQKKKDRISLSQFFALTGISKINICRAIDKLIKMNIIIIEKDNRKGNFYLIQKDYTRWKSLSKKIMNDKIIIKKDNEKGKNQLIQEDSIVSKSLSKSVTLNENNTKIIIKKDNEPLSISIMKGGKSLSKLITTKERQKENEKKGFFKPPPPPPSRTW